MLVRASAVLSFFGACMLQAAPVAHGHAHHELSHDHQELDQGLRNFSAVSQDDAGDHPHLESNPQLPQRLDKIVGAPMFATPDLGASTTAPPARAPLFWLEVRGPPLHPPSGNLGPRSPPLA